MSVSPAVVEANISFLLGLDVLTHLNALVDFQKIPCNRARKTGQFSSR